MLNAALIGEPGSRWKLQTPALVVDLDAAERNIARMADFVRRHNITLRPHAKTHKSAAFARLQIAAGAPGVCVAKLGEAEALAGAGIDSILITSPVVTEPGIARLAALCARTREILAVCDDPGIAQKLSDAAVAAGTILSVLVDIDPSLGRTGIPIGDGAVALVRKVAALPGLNYAGLQCYAGNLQHLEAPNERRERSLATMRELGQFRDRLAMEGLAPRIISGGGTGTFDIDPDAHVLTELQAGSYLFMDRQYRDVWTKPGEAVPFETSLFVQTTVVSTQRDGLATADAGLKSFATDAGPPEIAFGAPPEARYFFFGDEHGGILNGGMGLQRGHVLVCVVPHCDPTVNLYDVCHVVRGDVLEAIWPIDARGRSA
jgi:D-serine deaminase-like pyridoxal phosphate-dependent protein